MKSISIVYKRKIQGSNPSNNNEDKNGFRSTVQDFYSNTLQQVQSNNQCKGDNMRIQTARSPVKFTRRNVFSSLSIASLSTPQTNPLARSVTQKKLPISPMFNIKKQRQDSVFKLNIPDQVQQHLKRQISRKSLKTGNEKSRNAKLKPFYRGKYEKPVTLALSIDFIYDEFNFWTEEEIDQKCSKTWSLLSSLANIVWIARSQKSAKKLQIFAQSKGVRVDGIFIIDFQKKDTLTVSYSALQQEIKLLTNHKLLVINCLRCVQKQMKELNEFQFRNSLPILQLPSAYVHFVQVDMKNKHRFSILKKVLSQKLPQPSDLSKIIGQNNEKKGNLTKKTNQICLNQQSLQPFVSSCQRVQNLKQNLLTYFDQSFGLKTRVEGDSLTYIIGDMMKRNSHIAKQFYSSCLELDYCTKINENKARKSASILNPLNIMEYNLPVYLWFF